MPDLGFRSMSVFLNQYFLWTSYSAANLRLVQGE